MKVRLLKELTLGTELHPVGAFVTVPKDVADYLVDSEGAVVFEEEVIPAQASGKGKGSAPANKKGVADEPAATVTTQEPQSE